MGGDARYPVTLGGRSPARLATILTMALALLIGATVAGTAGEDGTSVTGARGEPGSSAPGVRSAMFATLPGGVDASTASVRWKLTRCPGPRCAITRQRRRPMRRRLRSERTNVVRRGMR